VVVDLAAGRLVVVVGIVEATARSPTKRRPAVGSHQDVGIEHQAGVALGHDGAVDGHDRAEVLGRRGQVVGAGDDRLAAPGLGVEDRHEVLLGGVVDAGHGLVEEVEIGLRGEGPGEEDTASLAAERARSGAGVGRHPHQVERVGDGRVVATARAAERPEARVATHHDDVAGGDREAPVDGLGLGT
jgi:hypothetical protein